jgi:circadian clock protein KaiB
MNSPDKSRHNGKKRPPAADKAASKLEKIVLKLYVTGQTPRSVRAIENLHKFCGSFLKGRFDLQVIDIYQEPALAKEVQILAAPTLIKSQPLPMRRLVGDFSDVGRVVSGLDIEAA